MKWRCGKRQRTVMPHNGYRWRETIPELWDSWANMVQIGTSPKTSGCLVYAGAWQLKCLQSSDQEESSLCANRYLSWGGNVIICKDTSSCCQTVFKGYKPKSHNPGMTKSWHYIERKKYFKCTNEQNQHKEENLTILYNKTYAIIIKWLAKLQNIIN